MRESEARAHVCVRASVHMCVTDLAPLACVRTRPALPHAHHVCVCVVVVGVMWSETMMWSETIAFRDRATNAADQTKIRFEANHPPCAHIHGRRTGRGPRISLRALGHSPSAGDKFNRPARVVG